MRPTTIRERIPEIDVLRGFALIGIIVANMRGFNSPMEVYIQPHLAWDSSTDVAVQGAIDLLITNKFMTLFAMLFGLGFAAQWERGGEAFRAVYVRRMAGLVVIGAAHAFLVWWGDILLAYAVVGFFLMPFRERSQESLLAWALGLYWLPVMMAAGIVVLSMASPQAVQVAPEATGEAIEQAVRIYTTGDFAELMAQRWQDWVAFNSSAPFYLPRVLGLFLFGVWVWRAGVLQRVEEHRALLGATLRWALPIGFAGNAGYVAIQNHWRPNPAELNPLNLGLWTLMSIAVPALSLFYASSVVLLYQRALGRRLLSPFAAVGRMALTNYLAQSVISTTVFYGYGLGLFGTVSPLGGLMLALGIYACQAAFSAGWASLFRFGPAEWVWRSVTYGRLQPVWRS